MRYDFKTKTWHYHGAVYAELIDGLRANDPRRSEGM